MKTPTTLYDEDRIARASKVRVAFGAACWVSPIVAALALRAFGLEAPAGSGLQNWQSVLVGTTVAAHAVSYFILVPIPKA